MNPPPSAKSDRIAPSKSNRPRAVVLLGFTSFFADISTEMLFPLLPFLVASAPGGIGIGLAVGLAGGLGDGIAQLTKIVGGHWSDRLERRKSLAAGGYALSALGKVGIAFASTGLAVVGFRAFERLGKGIRTAPRDALLAETASESNRGAAFGLHRAMDTAGAVVGVILALILLHAAQSSSRIAWVSAGIALLALAPIAFVREPRGREVSRKNLRVELAGLPPTFRRYLWVAATYGLANITLMFFILRASAYFSTPWAVVGPIALYLLYNLTYAGLAFPMGRLADRIGRRRLLLAGFLTFAAASAGFAFAYSLAVIVGLFVVLGVAYAIVEGTGKAVAVDLSDGVGKGTALGTIHTVGGLATILGGITAGLLWDTMGAQAAFIWAAIMAALGTVLLSKVSTPSPGGK